MKTQKIICFILSLLLAFPCLCLSSCDSASVGDIGGGLSTENTQGEGKNENPSYTAPAKYKELANDDTVYRSGMYTGYSIIISDPMKTDDGRYKGLNMCEVMLDEPGEAVPVHEDPTCSHDSARCPTSSDIMLKEFVIVKQESGLPLIFYFGSFHGAIYTEDGESKPAIVSEVRGYDVETGEYITISEIAMGEIQNAVLYKGKMYIVGNRGGAFGMLDIVSGESKIMEAEESYEGVDIYYNEYNILGIVDDRVYYMHVFGDEKTDDSQKEKNFCTLKSCSLDLDDVRTEYDFGDLGNDYHRGPQIMYHYSYMDGNMLYVAKNNRFTVDPEDYSPETVYSQFDFEIFDIYALDLNNTSEGEKLILKDVYKYAVKDGKLYYTLVDYKEVGETSSSWQPYIRMFASTDGGDLYEYDIDTGETREVCRDSGYNIYEIYEITDDGKMFFYGKDYVNFLPAGEGCYSSIYSVGSKEYCMLDISTGKVTELYAPLYLSDPSGEVTYS